MKKATSKPSDFVDKWWTMMYGECSNIEFRVDGYTLNTIEVDDDFTVALIDGNELVDISGPNELLRILMYKNGIKFESIHWYAELMLPNLESVVFIKGDYA